MSEIFYPNIGSPQGCSASPLFFIVLLNKAICDLKLKYPRERPLADLGLPGDAEYADDSDLLSTEKEYLEEMLPYVEKVFREYRLIVNADKTEKTTLSATDKDWQSVKKLGSLLGQEEDLKRRMQLAAVQFGECSKLWNTEGISLKTRLRLYNALVIPVLMYNAGTWALTIAQSKKLDTYHRKQLRKVLRIKWPQTISNKKLYNMCGIEEPISVRVGRLRWSLFGHILRLDDEVPAKKAMKLYFEQGKGDRGRPITTLPVVLWAEAKKVTGKQPTLASLNELAKDRKGWWEFSNKVIAKSYGESVKKVAYASNGVKRTWVRLG